MSLVKEFSRLLVITSDKNLGSNYVPPDPSTIISSVTDSNHTQQVASGLYTQAQVDALRTKAIQYLQNQFGIDFSSGTPLPGGMILKDSFIMIPYSNVNTGFTKVCFDSKNPDRGATSRWFGAQFGELIACQASGTFSSGTHSGETYNAGDILTCFDYNLVRTSGHPLDANQEREVIWCCSPWVNKFILNSQGYKDFFSKLEAVDEEGRVGFFDENITFNKVVSTGEVFTATRVVVTWS